jgi:hypothetical protein
LYKTSKKKAPGEPQECVIIEKTATFYVSNATMLINFATQLFFAVIFFAGIASGGCLIFSWLGYEARHKILHGALAYFLSLCFYTTLLVGALLTFPDKKIAAMGLTLCYFLISWVWWWQKEGKRNWSRRTILSKKYGLFLGILLICLFSFWLQIYNTSILDEWLHRPVTQTFIDRAQFPLVNPLQPEVNFIKTYHYGSHVVSGTIGFVTGKDASTSLDIFKLANALASLLLLYGLVFQITKSTKWALFGMVTTFFLASSFFFLDSFTATHLKSFKGLNLEKGTRWPLNIPLSFTLTGITWVNIPLMLAWTYFLENYFRKRTLTMFFTFFASIYFTGFFLISELFALLGLVGVGIIFLQQLYQKKIRVTEFIFHGLLLGTLIVVGIHFTGGVMGNVLDSVENHIQHGSPSADAVRIQDTRPILEGKDQINSKYFLELKKLPELGYPIGSKTLFVLDHPGYYVRTFLLEVVACCVFLLLVFRKKIPFLKYPVTISTVAIGFILPFIFHTKFGDLNFYKLAVYSLLVVHVGIFFLLSKLPTVLSRIPLLFFVVAGSLTGFLLGTNIQTDVFSSKGHGLYCSQNPMCYKGLDIELLQEFQQSKPQMKTILISEKDAEEVVDLTNSKIVALSSTDDSYLITTRIEYIYSSPNLREDKSKVFLEKLDSYEKIFEKGEFSILRVNNY